jgi:hypothetical protein
MDPIDKAIKFAKDFINNHPIVTEQVEDYLDLMLENIAEGDSPQNELDLFINACNQLLEDECND